MIYKEILVALVTLGLTGCGVRDVYPFLVQKCQAGETENVDGVPVAHTIVRLKNGEEIAAGEGLFRPNVIKNLGNGAISIVPANSDRPAENFSDGRIILLKSDKPLIMFRPDIRIAMTSLPREDVTILEFTLNCQEPATNPPVKK